MDFYYETVEQVVAILTYLIGAEKKKENVSDTLLEFLIRVFDMILKLDALKNMKAALANDFSALKR